MNDVKGYLPKAIQLWQDDPGITMPAFKQKYYATYGEELTNSNVWYSRMKAGLVRPRVKQDTTSTPGVMVKKKSKHPITVSQLQYAITLIKDTIGIIEFIKNYEDIQEIADAIDGFDRLNEVMAILKSMHTKEQK